jgi:hypothetical protein
MKTTKLQNQQEYFIEAFDLPNPGLRAFFERAVNGQPEEYRTPFYKGKSLSDILEGWSSTLNTIESKWPTLLEFENDLREKVGPMSIMLPLKERMDDIESYYDSILLESKPISSDAVRRTVAEFQSICGIRLSKQSNTIANMKLNTNSGAPYFRDRNKVHLHLPVECKMMGEFAWTNDPSHPFTCAILGWRGQEGGPEKDDVKQRVIWMFPYLINVAELSFYQPLIKAIQRKNLVPAWVGMESVDAAITRLFDTKGKDDLIVCTDFSKFDQHFNNDMQSCAKQVFTSLGVDTNWLRDVFPIKYNIPLAFNYGEVKFGPHGMASGSGGTNADETMTHRCLQHEAALLSQQQLNPNSQCLGDDGILSFPGITVEDVMRSYTAHGQEMNLDKQYASTQDCTYLRRWHHKDYRINGVCAGVYSTYRALGRLAEQERFYDPDKWSSKMVALRQLSIIENCKYHPLREQFADYCMKGDKYRLGIDIPGFLDKIEVYAKEATDYMPDFLGYTKSLQKNSESGIKNWWIVQYLKSKK